jgi:hypothetical protein
MSEFPDSTVLAEDPVSRFFGPEYPGRVRGAGSGVTPSRYQLAVRGERLTQDLHQTAEEREAAQRQIAELQTEMRRQAELAEARQAELQAEMHRQVSLMQEQMQRQMTEFVSGLSRQFDHTSGGV